jgi:GNAT superfamily N-acetyltransferase
MAPVSVRSASSRDLDALLRLEQAIVAAERPFDPTLRASDVRYYDIAGLLAEHDARMVVAEAAGEVIGCGFARIQPAKPYLKHREHAYLGLMYVAPGYRGTGINQQIVDALKNWCRQRRITELRLDVYSANTAAVRAYEKAGFSKHLVEMRLALEE